MTTLGIYGRWQLEDELAGTLPAARSQRRDYSPNEPRRPDGKWGTGSAVHKLLKSLHDTKSHSGVYFDDDHYIDWSSRKSNGSFTVEFGDGDEAMQMDFTPDEMATWQEALTESLRTGHSNGIQVGEHGSLDWEPADDDAQEWDIRATNDDGDEAAYEWSAARMHHLHTALTTTLLADAIGTPDGADRARRLTDSLRVVGEAVATRAVPHPGNGEAFHRYWTKGPGLAKWAESPKPWTTLHALLAEYIKDKNELDRTTSAWFQDVFGFSAGSDLNRVTHGKPPRGKKIGPG